MARSRDTSLYSQLIRKLRQEDCKLKACLGPTDSSRPTWTTLARSWPYITGSEAGSQQGRDLPDRAGEENEAPDVHSRRVHGNSLPGQSCRRLPRGKWEMNLSETAFIRKLQPSDNFTQSACFGLRWFTPVSEVPLCGHATLASAAVLFHKIKNTNSSLTFVTMSGELKARRAEDGIVLDFPLYPTLPQDVHEVEDLIKTAIGNTLVQDIRYSPDTRKLLVRLSDSYNRSFLETLKVNTEPLPRIEKTGKVKGLILTLKGEPGGQTPQYDFYSRYFAPWIGLPEDPVTVASATVFYPSNGERNYNE